MLDCSRFLTTARVGLVVTYSLLASLEGAAQGSPCDRGLEALARGPHGYVLRGNRCEGVYAQQVSGSALWVASFTQFFEEYDLTSGADLLVEWAAPANLGVRLRAQGIKPELYYRMDAVDTGASHSFRWPSDLLAAQHISREDIGVLGWTRYSLGGVDRDVYVPLRIRQHKSAPETDRYELVLFPAVELKEVYLSLAAVGPDGRPRSFIEQGKRLGYGFYPAERPVRIRLRGLGDPGVYYLEIGAELAGGGTAALTYWIYHDRRPRPQ